MTRGHVCSHLYTSMDAKLGARKIRTSEVSAPHARELERLYSDEMAFIVEYDGAEELKSIDNVEELMLLFFKALLAGHNNFLYLVELDNVPLAFCVLRPMQEGFFQVSSVVTDRRYCHMSLAKALISRLLYDRDLPESAVLYGFLLKKMEATRLFYQTMLAKESTDPSGSHRSLSREVA